MPIWRSSELLTGRSGSPSRKALSARSSASQNRSGLLTALPPPRYSDTDGKALNEQQADASGPSQAAVDCTNPQITENGCDSNHGRTDWEPTHPNSTWSGTPAGASGGSVSLLRDLSRQSSRNECQVVVGAPGVRANTYTVQYIGIANGELGILSQKQKLPTPVPGPVACNAAMPSSNVRLSRRQSRASSSSSSSTRTPRPVAPAVTSGAPTLDPAASPSGARPTASAVVSATAARLTATAQPISASRSPQTAVVPDPTVPGPGVYSHDTAASMPAVASGGVTDDVEDRSTGSGQAKPPNLVNIVDDAYGQVKVITECFYSRALHSRATPRDRHIRLNRPSGPQVQDMEPLSTALPGCFGHQAPSAGGFPGWKLTAPLSTPTTTPRRTYSGTGSGFSSLHKQQRACSAQPFTGSVASPSPSPPAVSTVTIGSVAVSAAADVAVADVAEAAAGMMSSVGSSRRTSDASSLMRCDKPSVRAASVVSSGDYDAGFDGGEVVRYLKGCQAAIHGREGALLNGDA